MFVLYRYKYVLHLFTSHNPINTNNNLADKSYFCLILLANLADILRSFDVRSNVIDFFDTFSPSKYDIPLGTLDH